MSRGRRRERGFTLIELMIVVAIIGILAAVAIPKFASLLRKSNEGQVKGQLASMRSALTVYYSDMEGVYPADFNSLTIAGRYLGAIPSLHVPDYHPSTTVIRHNQFVNAFGCGSGYVLDTGEWIYWSDNGALCSLAPAPVGQRARTQGEIWVACAHTDTKSNEWTSY